MTARVIDLMWHGADTVEAASAEVRRSTDVALHLPASFHHAVAAHFRSPDAHSSVEAVGVNGGAELLARLCAIHGLEPLAALVPPVERAHARVRVSSPSPTVAIRRRGGAGARAS